MVIGSDRAKTCRKTLRRSRAGGNLSVIYYKYLLNRSWNRTLLKNPFLSESGFIRFKDLQDKKCIAQQTNTLKNRSIS